MIPGYGSSRMREETVASAATIVVKADLVKITGTTGIDNIQSPLRLNSRGGQLIFVTTPDAGLTISAAGNVASSLVVATDKLYALAWSTLRSKWIPQGL